MNSVYGTTAKRRLPQAVLALTLGVSLTTGVASAQVVVNGNFSVPERVFVKKSENPESGKSQCKDGVDNCDG